MCGIQFCQKKTRALIVDFMWHIYRIFNHACWASSTHIILLSFFQGVHKKDERAGEGRGWGASGWGAESNTTADNCLCLCFLQWDRPAAYGCHGRPSRKYQDKASARKVILLKTLSAFRMCNKCLTVSSQLVTAMFHQLCSPPCLTHLPQTAQSQGTGLVGGSQSSRVEGLCTKTVEPIESWPLAWPWR